jgi:hypothetical protein
MLAFGAIPVTATVHLTQPSGPRGAIDPLHFSWLILGSQLASSGGWIAGYGNFQGSVGSEQRFFIEPLAITGPVDVRVSDVKVDGVPLDVGGHCQTASPAQLSIVSPGGYYLASDSNGNSVLTSTLVGRPGGFQPIGSHEGNASFTGSAQGNIDIPAFTDCSAGGDDVSSLITAMASGPKNPVDLKLSEAMDQCGATKTPCPPYPTK